MTTENPAAPRRSRWLVLGGFSLLVACTQLLWLTFAPITTQAHHALGVSEGAIGDLAVINPLMYVLLALPTGRWLDRRFGRALSAGALLTAGGALLRLAGPGSYAWILAGQVVLSAGQPLVLNATTKVAARYFPASQRTAAISVASAAQFCGILAAALTGGPLQQAGGLRLLLLVQAVVAVAGAACVLVAVRVPATFAADSPVAISLRWLRRDRVMWLLAGLLFIGVGVFNAVATWLDAILGHFGHGGASGTLIAIMTVAGIAGAAVLPGAVARRDRRRTMLLVTTAVTAVVFLAIAAVPGVLFAGCALAVEGFVLLAGLPVSLDWSELHAGPERAGTAAGFLLLAGNLGGVLFVVVIQAVIGNPYVALAAISVLALPGLALAARLPARVGPGLARVTGPDGPGPGGGSAADGPLGRKVPGPARDA
ncbi:MAG: MFS transporter [Streptosporangiales bacterium]